MEHGGDLAEAIGRYGGAPSDWLDLSTGINPHAWPVPHELRQEGWARLPSRDALAALLTAARQAYAVPDRLAIVAAPGTQAIIQWLPHLASPGQVAILGPTYSEHARAWAAAGTPVREIGAPEDAPGDAHLIVVNPNNPDGRIVEPRRLLNLRAGTGWLVVDESFADVRPEVSVIPHLDGTRPAVVLRSFGKFFGLAGLRLGFAVAPPALAGRIAAALGPWAVSAPALAIGRAALADAGWIADTRIRLAGEMRELDEVLTAWGARVVGGTSLYRLAETTEAAAHHDRLARARIWTRRFEDRPNLLRFGLPPCRESLRRLAEALGGGTPHAVTR